MVLILHPSDELKFIRLQKKITASFNADGFRVYPEIPLWTAVPDKAAEKLAAGKARLEIGAPETDRSKATIRCPAEIRTESGTYGAELVLCRMESVPDDAEKRLMRALGENAEKKEPPETPCFPAVIRIFRLAEEIPLPAENARALSGSVWRKSGKPHS